MFLAALLCKPAVKIQFSFTDADIPGLCRRPVNSPEYPLHPDAGPVDQCPAGRREYETCRWPMVQQMPGNGFAHAVVIVTDGWPWVIRQSYISWCRPAEGLRAAISSSSSSSCSAPDRIRPSMPIFSSSSTRRLFRMCRSKPQVATISP